VSRAFTIVELLVVIAIVVVLAGLAVTTMPGLMERAARADALAKTRTMGQAVLHYVPDHAGKLPALFPGQVLEYEPGRGGRIVTECTDYLGINQAEGKYVVTSLMPRAYARQTMPANPAQMRVWVMNGTMTNKEGITYPFGSVTTPGQPPTGNRTLAAVPHITLQWMISTADQEQPNVEAASWKANAPPKPPLGNVRAVFRFDGSAGLVNISQP
jgi:prepilin-type N-terminal cleavage/methylation domain-containing protein